MVKNLKGGKGHKNLARKHIYGNDSSVSNVRKKVDEFEHYAFVDSILGNGHLYVNCDDDVKRLCRIPGKFKKKRRDNLVTKTGFLLIGCFDFGNKDKCELLEVYSEQEYNRIFTSEIDEKLLRFMNTTTETSHGAAAAAADFDFVFNDDDVGNDNDSKMATVTSSFVNTDENIDIDSI